MPSSVRVLNMIFFFLPPLTQEIWRRKRLDEKLHLLKGIENTIDHGPEHRRKQQHGRHHHHHHMHQQHVDSGKELSVHDHGNPDGRARISPLGLSGVARSCRCLGHVEQALRHGVFQLGIRGPLGFHFHIFSMRSHKGVLV